MSILPIILILSAILFILFQRSQIRILKTDNFYLTLNLSIMSFTLSSNQNKKQVLKNLYAFLRKGRPIYKSVKYLVRRSDIHILRFSPIGKQANGFGQVLSYYISAPILLAYLNNTAKSIRYSDNYSKFSNNNSEIDINVNSRLIFLIISALVFLYYIVISKIKRGIKNV